MPLKSNSRNRRKLSRKIRKNRLSKNRKLKKRSVKGGAGPTPIKAVKIQIRHHICKKTDTEGRPGERRLKPLSSTEFKELTFGDIHEIIDGGKQGYYVCKIGKDGGCDYDKDFPDEETKKALHRLYDPNNVFSPVEDDY